MAQTQPGPDEEERARWARFSAIEMDLVKIQAELRESRKAMNALELEWADIYEKMRGIANRLAKRDKRAEKTAQDALGATNDAGDGPDPTPLNSAALYGRRRA